MSRLFIIMRANNFMKLSVLWDSFYKLTWKFWETKNQETNKIPSNTIKTLTTVTNKDRKQYLSRASPITGAVNETSSPDVPPLLVRPFRIQNGAVSGVTSPPAILSARAPLTGNGSEWNEFPSGKDVNFLWGILSSLSEFFVIQLWHWVNVRDCKCNYI